VWIFLLERLQLRPSSIFQLCCHGCQQHKASRATTTTALRHHHMIIGHALLPLPPTSMSWMILSYSLLALDLTLRWYHDRHQHPCQQHHRRCWYWWGWRIQQIFHGLEEILSSVTFRCWHLWQQTVSYRCRCHQWFSLLSLTMLFLRRRSKVTTNSKWKMMTQRRKLRWRRRARRSRFGRSSRHWLFGSWNGRINRRCYVRNGNVVS
jgi:hypothetical protein